MKHLYVKHPVATRSAYPVRRAVRRLQTNTLAVVALALASAVLAPAAASAQRIDMPVTGKVGPNEGKRPAGWIVRADGDKQGAADSVHLINRGDGYYLTSGATSLVWNPKNVATGKFILVTALTSGASGAMVPDGFGVFLGGKNMQGPNAQYTEFLVRNDGKYAVLQHTGAKVVKLRDWTQIAGINLHNGRRDYLSRNVFRVIVDAGNVQLVVNRALVTAIPRAVFGPDGEYGMRIGTKQVIQIESMGLEKPAK